MGERKSRAFRLISRRDERARENKKENDRPIKRQRGRPKKIKKERTGKG